MIKIIYLKKYYIFFSNNYDIYYCIKHTKKVCHLAGMAVNNPFQGGCIVKSFVVLFVILGVAVQSAALEQKSEAELYHSFIGTTYVDYIVTDIMPDISNMIFEFEIGDLNAFENSSLYYYFYQVENHLANDAVEYFEIQVDGSAIVTAGYISNPLDLDDVPFSHTGVPGDNEYVQVALVNPSDMAFYPGGVFPGITIPDWFVWDFSFTDPVNPGEESTVLFLTSNLPPADTAADALVIDFLLEGTVSGPSAVPEPSAMALFLFGGLWIMRKYRRRN